MGFRFLPSEEEEGRSIGVSVWGAAAAEDWPGDFFLLRVVTLVKIPYVFSQWPHLSELEHHSRYLVYRLAGRS